MTICTTHKYVRVSLIPAKMPLVVKVRQAGYPNANPINISGPIYVRAFYMSEDMDEPVYTDVTTEDKKLIVATILRSYTATVLPAKVLRLYTAPKRGPPHSHAVRR